MLRRACMLVTDIGMLLYWIITTLNALSVIDVPMDWLFKDYNDPRVVAWNWSFLPLDVALSVTGLWALRLEKSGKSSWRVWSAVSMTLTVCAGLMAISYWWIMREFDPVWWIPNLFLLIWPLPFLWHLAHEAR